MGMFICKAFFGMIKGMKPVVLLCFILWLVGCGKVAQDINTQSAQSNYKQASFKQELSNDPPHAWLPTANASTMVYSYLEGLVFDKGFEKIGWVQADIRMPAISTKNTTATITSYDAKKNSVTSPRYHQGVISLTKTTTDNITITTRFDKIRSTFDYYVLWHYTDNDSYHVHVSNTIPSASVTLSTYDHIVSATFLNHMKKEAYNTDTIIPLSMFYAIVPTESAITTQNVVPTNNVANFKANQPKFVYDLPLFNQLIDTVTYAHLSDEYDTLEYAKDAFREPLRSAMLASIKRHFERTSTPNQQND